LVVVCFYRNDLRDNVLPYHMRMGPRPYATIENGVVDIVEEIDEAPFSAFCIPMPLSVSLYKSSYIFYALTDRVYVQRNRPALTELDRANMERVPWADCKTVFFHLVEKMDALASANGAEFALFLIPSQQEVAARKSDDLEHIAGWAAEHGIDCVHALEPMVRAADEGRKPYFSVDIHWTRAGHEVAAATLGKYLHAKRTTR
jgi:hypothetical protein